MCVNCESYEYCDCDGGASLAACSCQTGEWCSVCGHEADAHNGPDAPLLAEAELTIDARTSPL
jgi:hypothetical protein